MAGFRPVPQPSPDSMLPCGFLYLHPDFPQAQPAGLPQGGQQRKGLAVSGQFLPVQGEGEALQHRAGAGQIGQPLPPPRRRGEVEGHLGPAARSGR